jgi:hypothetical protein
VKKRPHHPPLRRALIKTLRSREFFGWQDFGRHAAEVLEIAAKSA